VADVGRGVVGEFAGAAAEHLNEAVVPAAVRRAEAVGVGEVEPAVVGFVALDSVGLAHCPGEPVKRSGDRPINSVAVTPEALGDASGAAHGWRGVGRVPASRSRSR